MDRQLKFPTELFVTWCVDFTHISSKSRIGVERVDSTRNEENPQASCQESFGWKNPRIALAMPSRCDFRKISSEGWQQKELRWIARPFRASKTRTDI
jgi:hypothetical protein